MNPHANNANDDDDDVDTTGGRIIVCAEFSIPSQTKTNEIVLEKQGPLCLSDTDPNFVPTRPKYPTL